MAVAAVGYGDSGWSAMSVGDKTGGGDGDCICVLVVGRSYQTKSDWEVLLGRAAWSRSLWATQPGNQRHSRWLWHLTGVITASL